MAQDQPAPGLKFMGLRYRNEWAAAAAKSSSRVEALLTGWQKAGYLLFAVIFRWAWARASAALATLKTQLEQRRRMLAMLRGEEKLVAEERIAEEENRWQNQLLFAGDKVARLFKVITFANMVVFVYDGKYGTVVDRLLGMRLVHAQRFSPRNIPFDFMNQQLVFDELTSFVQFLVPLFRVLANVPPLKWILGGNTKAAKVSTDPAMSQDLDLDSCMVCGTEVPIMPHVGRCGHVGCYVCLMNGLLEDRGYACQRCGSQLEQLRPWGAAGG